MRNTIREWSATRVSTVGAATSMADAFRTVSPKIARPAILAFLVKKDSWRTESVLIYCGYFSDEDCPLRKFKVLPVALNCYPERSGETPIFSQVTGERRSLGGAQCCDQQQSKRRRRDSLNYKLSLTCIVGRVSRRPREARQKSYAASLSLLFSLAF